MKRVAPALVLCGCIGTKTVPPPGEPLPIPPAALHTDAPPPAPGKGRLVLDVVGARATVFEIVESKETPSGRDLAILCDTPCAVNLSRGKHQLAFVSPRGHVARETVEVFAQPTIVREQLGYTDTHPVVWYAGALSACTAAIGVLIGLALVAQGDGEGRDPARVREVRETGAAVLAASGGLFGAAWLLLHLGRTESQPGRMTSFPEHGRAGP